MDGPTIPVVDLNISEKEINQVTKVVSSRYLIEGPNAREFEKKFKAFTGAKHAITAVNGTSALHLALTVLNIGPKDEVITTPFTFVASSNTILYNGSIPVFVDVDLNTYNIDPTEIEKAITDKTKAILPVHIFGNPCNMKLIKEIAEKHDLFVIEDCAQAHDARINGKHVGNFGDIGVFSFYGTKNLIGGEGGALICNNDDLQTKITSLKNHGRNPEGGYSHYYIGYNYRTTDMSAAIMNVQMDRAPEILKRRHQNGNLYRKQLQDFDYLQIQEILKGHKPSDYIFSPIIRNCDKKPQEIISILKEHNIASRTIYSVLNYEQPAYRNINDFHLARVINYPDYSKFKCPNAEYLARNHFELPMVSSLTDEQINYIIDKVKSFFEGD